jgi:hypothetical protein
VVAADRQTTRWDAWDRFSPLAGIVAVLLWIVGIFVIEGANSPDEGAAAAEYASYYDEESGTLLGGGVVWLVGSLFFLWFLGTLRAAVHAAEGGFARMTGIVFAGGLAFGLFSMAIVAPDLSAASVYYVDEETLEPAAAQALNSLGDGFFILAEYCAVLMLAATGVAALRTRVLPAWLGWVSIALAVLMLIPPIGWAGLIFGVPLWIVLVSVLLATRRAPAEPVLRDAVV